MRKALYCGLRGRGAVHRRNLLAAFLSTSFLTALLPAPSPARLSFSGIVPSVSTGGAVPFGIAVADLNHDGEADLIVSGAGIEVRPGLGGGYFGEKTDYLPGSVGSAVAAADLDGDGNADLVTIDATTGIVSTLRGRGDGAFDASTQVPLDFGARSLTVGDLDGDGSPDIVVTRGIQNTSAGFSILFGNGDATFRPQVNLEAGVGASSAALGDVNGDGRTDIVVGNWAGASVSVHLGLGDGAFTPGIQFPTGVYCRVVALGDLNDDGRPDVVTAGSYGGVSVLLGNGDGSFGDWVVLESVSRPTSVVIADLDGDLDQDLVVTSEGYYDPEYPDNSGFVLFFGAGDGTFGRRRYESLGYGPQFALVADLTRDSTPDLLVVNGGSRSISILLGRGGGEFGAQGIPSAGNPTALVSADLDADGHMDLAVANDGTHNVSVVRSQGNGLFGPRQDFQTGWSPNSIAAGDMNADGRLDLLAACRQAQTISVLLGRGDGNFGTNTDFGTEAIPSQIQLGDFDEDGRLDAAVLRSDRAIGISRGLGDGFLASPTRFPIDPSGYADLRSGDLDDDGHLDFVLSRYDGDVHVFRGGGDGKFLAPSVHPAGEYPFGSVIDDLNEDGHTDLAVVIVDAVLVFPGDGAGGLGAAIRVPTRRGLARLAVADLDGDGHKDLVLTGSAGFGVKLGEGGLSFASMVEYETGRGPGAIAISDMNADGRPDVVVTSTWEHRIFVLLNGERPTPVAVEALVAQSVEGGVRLTWSLAAPTHDEWVGVRVERAETAAGPWSELTPEPLAPAAHMSFLDATAVPRHELWYRLLLERRTGSPVLAGPVSAVPFVDGDEGAVLLGAREIGSDGTVRIAFRLGGPSAGLRLEIFDVRGRRIQSLFDGPSGPGEHRLLWNRAGASGARVGRGVYLVHLQDGVSRDTRKLVLLQD